MTAMDWRSREALVDFFSTPSISCEQPFILETRGIVSLHFDHFATQSLMSKRKPDQLMLDYTRTMMGFLLLVPDPAQITMIGLGGGSLAKYCHRHLPGASIIAVEISPEVIALRDAFQIPVDGPRFEVVCMDGAEYISREKAAADVILLDAFAAQGVPDQCASEAFFAACRQRLSRGGLLVANFVDDDPALRAYLERIDAVFGASRAVLTSTDGGNFLVFAWNGLTPLPSGTVLRERAKRFLFSEDLGLHALAARLKKGQSFNPSQLCWVKQARQRWCIA
jgi:spermidine synthase